MRGPFWTTSEQFKFPFHLKPKQLIKQKTFPFV